MNKIKYCHAQNVNRSLLLMIFFCLFSNITSDMRVSFGSVEWLITLTEAMAHQCDRFSIQSHCLLMLYTKIGCTQTNCHLHVTNNCAHKCIKSSGMNCYFVIFVLCDLFCISCIAMWSHEVHLIDCSLNFLIIFSLHLKSTDKNTYRWANGVDKILITCSLEALWR